MSEHRQERRIGESAFVQNDKGREERFAKASWAFEL